jgi:hypothetical protein
VSLPKIELVAVVGGSRAACGEARDHAPRASLALCDIILLFPRQKNNCEKIIFTLE